MSDTNIYPQVYDSKPAAEQKHGASGIRETSSDQIAPRVWVHCSFPLACLAIAAMSAAVMAFISCSIGQEMSCLFPSVTTTVDSPPCDLATVVLADYPSLIDAQNKIVKQLLEGPVHGSALSRNILGLARMQVTELETLVCHSYPQDQHLISELRSKFTLHARSASLGLHWLASQTWYIVGGFEARSEYALQKIQDAHHSQFFRSLIRLLFSRAVKQLSPNDAVLKLFTDHMEYLSAMAKRLIVQVQACIKELQELESILVALHDASTWEEQSIPHWHTVLLRGPWSCLGGRQGHLFLLKSVGNELKGVSSILSASLLALQEFNQGLEFIRRTIDSDACLIPVEMQMESIQAGLKVMNGLRLGAKEKKLHPPDDVPDM
ncbi:hypothetical protein IW261DRAFT_1573745 [Armillaria novae-zelandiae]|uniref:Uncharacterized protein n=1 Tax=Armillaria novae-zelandiae TaxID=153914 RepID=A0AA39NMR4_9AGAR|nr:hypothetical protein IW261DRAFT_1573745 [Armillaria novae-zelandiae]